MLARSLLVLALLLSADLGVDAKKRGRSPRKSEKLYRKSKRYAKKLRGFWLRLGVKPFIVEEGKVGEPCMLKSEVEAGYLRRSTVSRDYVRKSEVACAGVVVEGDVGDVGGGVDEEKESLSPRETAKLYRKAGKFQKKLRSAWALLGVRPYLVQPGEEGDECVLTSKVEADWMLKTAVEAEYVLKSAAEACHDCDGVPNGPNTGDCSGDCFGTKENDACGVCDGDGAFCANSPSSKVMIESTMDGSTAVAAINKAFEYGKDVEITDGIDFGFAEESSQNPISVPDGRTLHVNGGVNAYGVTITINGGGAVINHGTLKIDSLNVEDGGTLTNGEDGTINNDGTIYNSGKIDNDGAIDNAGAIDNSGTIENAGTINTAGFFFNYGTINTAGAIGNSGTIENYGTINTAGFFFNYGTIESDGTINNDGNIGNNGTIKNRGMIENDGMIENQSTINNDGTINSGDGTINNRGTINNDGTIENPYCIRRI